MNTGLKIDLSYEKDFASLWNGLKRRYPKELFELDGVGSNLDINLFRKRFFDNDHAVADVSVDANANVSDKSIVSFPKELEKPMERQDSYFVMWDYARRVFDKNVANRMVKAQLSGDVYINDFHGMAAGFPYCFNYSTYDIATKGLPMLTSPVSSPPKYLCSFLSQVEQFVVIASNSTLGATGMADLLLVLSFYVEDILANKGDEHFKFSSVKDCWAYVKASVSSMIYTINQPGRANQSPFTNVSVYDDIFLKKMRSDYIHPIKGTPLNLKVVRQLQELYLDVMNEELSRTPITFPVTTACFSARGKKVRDAAFKKMIASKNVKYNFINIYMGKSSTISSCCRLRSDLNNEYFNSFGAGSTKIGSLGVATVNYPRLAYKCKGRSSDYFLKKVREMVKLAFQINYVKLQIIKDRIEGGFHPLYSHGFIDVKKQYLTNGINGHNEMLEILGLNPLSKEGIAMGLRVMKTINRVNSSLGKEYGVPVNIEQVPAESSSVKLADKDRLLGFNKEYRLYSNQFIPLTADVNLLDRIRIQGVYDKLCSGGSIGHYNMEECISVEDMELMIDLCASVGVIYFAVNVNLQACEDYHMVVGRRKTCLVCGKDIVNDYTRVVGFLTNTKHWNKVRREADYPNRRFYKSI